MPLFEFLLVLMLCLPVGYLALRLVASLGNQVKKAAREEGKKPAAKSRNNPKERARRNYDTRTVHNRRRY